MCLDSLLTPVIHVLYCNRDKKIDWYNKIVIITWIHIIECINVGYYEDILAKFMQQILKKLTNNKVFWIGIVCGFLLRFVEGNFQKINKIGEKI